jgi:hypothetical protein
LTGLRILWRSLWVPFEADFNIIMVKMKRHQELVDIEAMTEHMFKTQGMQESNLKVLEVLQDVQQEAKQARLSLADNTKINMEVRILRVIRWLSPPNPQNDLDRMQAIRHVGTNTWFLKENVFVRWLEDSKSDPILWIFGIPG